MFTSILLSMAVFVACGVLMQGVRLYGAGFILKAVLLPVKFSLWLLRRRKAHSVSPQVLPVSVAALPTPVPAALPASSQPALQD